MQTAAASPSPSPGEPLPEKSGRSCLGCFFTSSLGCVAFLTGSVGAMALFAPRMLGTPVAAFLQGGADDAIDGEVQIEDLELAWTERQKVTGVTLLDPDGNEVLEVTAWVPSLWDLFARRSEGIVHEYRARVKFAEIVVGADGVSNLARTFAVGGRPRPPGEWFGPIDPGDRIDSRLELQLDHVRVEDERTGETYELEDGQLELRRVRAERVELSFRSSVSCGDQRGTLAFELQLEREGGAPRAVTASFEADELSAAVADALLASLAPRLAGLGVCLGPVLGARGTLAGDLGGSAVLALHLSSGERFIELAGTLEEGVLRPGDDGRLAGSVLVAPSACEGWIEPWLPDGTRLARESSAAWRLAASDFALPLGLGTPAGFAMDPLLTGARSTCTLFLADPLRLVDARTEHELAALAGARVTVELAPDAPLRAELAGDLADGRLQASLTSHLPAAQVLHALARGGQVPSGLALELRATGLPADLLDRSAGQDGLVAELFGRVVDLVYRSSDFAAEPRVATVELSAGPRRRLSEAVLEGGLLRSLTAGRLELHGPFGPGVRERVLGPLLPWLTDVEPVDASQEVLLVVEEFTLPLDRDLARLAARVRLELGEVRYRLHPALGDLFEVSPDADPRAEVLLPIVLTIDRGVVRYEELTLGLAGDDSDFAGTLDLATGTVAVQAGVPMRALRRQFGIDEEMAAILLENEVVAEVQIVGTWNAPTVMVDTGAVKQIMNNSFVRDVAVPALRRAIRAFTTDGG